MARDDQHHPEWRDGEAVAGAGIDEILRQIEMDLGLMIARNPPVADLESLPEALRPIYAISDGLELPCGQVYRANQMSSRGFSPEWICFGFDGYFSYYLCRVEPLGGLSLATWDHELGLTLEPFHATAADWLAAEYNDFIKGGGNVATIAIRAVPDSLDIVPLAKEVTRAWDLSIASLVNALRHPPGQLQSLEAETALAVVRRLRQAGIDCVLQNVRSKDGDDSSEDEE